MTDYPDELLRGISSKEDVTSEGYASSAAFRFEDYDSERGDDFCEASINWVDDEGAVDVLLRQTKIRKGAVQPQFRAGYCRFARATLHNALDSFFVNGYLSYERKPLEADELNPENKYHGNILLNKDVSKPLKQNIQATLATLAGPVVRRDDL